MPSMIKEVKESLSDIQKLPTYEKPRHSIAPCSGFMKRMTGARRGVQESEYAEELREHQDGWERPIDTLARKNPYIYADALLG
jgi:hypothetical protein